MATKGWQVDFMRLLQAFEDAEEEGRTSDSTDVLVEIGQFVVNHEDMFIGAIYCLEKRVSDDA